MIRFIQSIPNVVERLVARIASPAVQDMIIRIVSAEEAGVPGVIEWLSSERLIPRLLAFLSPFHPPSAHVIAAELLKSIVTLCAPSPFNPQGGNVEQQAGGAGTRDNRLVRELVSEESVSTLIGFMLDPIDLSDSDFEPSSPSDPFVVHALPSVASASSSLVHICSIITELIRRNNSDFSEPHLFHTLRNRLMSIRMQPGPLDDEEEMKQLEDNMNELSGKMGIVHLGTLLTLLSDRFDRLHSLLLHPRTRSPGLTMERFRIIELYAELLHSSNMSILNRVPGRGPEYTADGILSGGLSGLEALGEAIDGDRVGENDEAQVTEARELPVSSGSTDASFTSDVTSEDEKMLEDIDEETPSASPAASGTLHPPPPSQADAERLRDVMEAPPGTSDASVSHAAVAATTAAQSIASDPETQSAEPPRDEDVLASGDKFKQMYIQHRVLPTVVDLFFEYPNNDFLHHVVYDLFQQILNGRLGPGLNRELVIELIREARLIERVLDAQRLNERVT
jgi:SIT4-associating protein SAP185/190